MSTLQNSGQIGDTLGLLLNDFIGQDSIKPVLDNAIEAAKAGKFLNHVCFIGGAGLGKTSLAELISRELGTNCVKVDARSLKSITDVLNIVIDLKNNDVFFIDEIHGLDKHIEEMMYGLLDNQIFQYQAGGKVIPIKTSKFILVGATTKPSEITKPLFTRFGLVLHLNSYSNEELSSIIEAKVKDLGFSMTSEARHYLARCSRGTVRICEKFITRIHDSVILNNITIVGIEIVMEVIGQLGIDYYGLNRQDREFLKILKERFGNQPTGINTLAMSMGESEDNLMETVEPYLVKSGFIQRTSRGRMLTDFGLEMLN